MTSKEYKEMIQCGKWLETFLKPNLKATQYRWLAKKFINKYQVEFELSADDLSLRFLELMEDQPGETGADCIRAFYHLDIKCGTFRESQIKSSVLVKGVILNVFRTIKASQVPWECHFAKDQLPLQQNANIKMLDWTYDNGTKYLEIIDPAFRSEYENIGRLGLLSAYGEIVQTLVPTKDGLQQKTFFY